MVAASVDMADVYKQITVRVTVTQRPITGIRARLSVWLVRLAAFVAPWGMEVDDG